MKSEPLLQEFIDYCAKNPELRFWQALRNWSEVDFLCARQLGEDIKGDTFYWTKKKG